MLQSQWRCEWWNLNFAAQRLRIVHRRQHSTESATVSRRHSHQPSSLRMSTPWTLLLARKTTESDSATAVLQKGLWDWFSIESKFKIVCHVESSHVMLHDMVSLKDGSSSSDNWCHCHILSHDHMHVSCIIVSCNCNCTVLYSYILMYHVLELWLWLRLWPSFVCFDVGVLYCAVFPNLSQSQSQIESESTK